MSSKITKETVKHIARLANLKFSPDQLATYTQKFARVIEYVEKLNMVDIKNIEPTSHALEMTGWFRDDIVKNFSDTDKMLEIAPEKDGRFIQVPRVIE